MKRFIDIVFSSTGMIIISPFAILVIVYLWLFEGRPIFFFQERLGKDAQPFTIIKFRTMSSSLDSTNSKTLYTKSISPFGRFLRATGIDELPQLFNVLRGEMSAVGPRALPVRYLPFFTEKERKRFEVKPGITGLAQIRGRRISWEEKFRLDLNYNENATVLLDLKIILLTPIVLFREFLSRTKPINETPLDEERGKPIGH